MKSRCGLNKGEYEILEKEFYKDIELMCSDFFETIGVSLPKGSRDIYKIAQKMNFDVRKAKLKDINDKKVEGVLLVDETQNNIDGFNGPRGIALNYLNSPMENRFIVAHELSHYIVMKQIQENFDDKVILQEARTAHILGQERSIFEQIIDYMAAAILIPAKDFKQRLKEARDNQEAEQSFINRMCDVYNMPRDAIIKRIEEVDSLDDEQ